MADARVADPLSEAEMVNGNTGRPVRSDARRNEDAVLEAAKHVFAASGVDARHLRRFRRSRRGEPSVTVAGAPGLAFRCQSSEMRRPESGSKKCAWVA
jgi:hypothetical protein